MPCLSNFNDLPIIDFRVAVCYPFFMAPKRILIIDDDPDLTVLYEKQFAEAGFEVEILKEGKSALSRIKRYSPDLILLDVLLDHTNGLDLLKEIKADPATSSIPVYVLSNVAEEVSLNKAMGLGAHEYLTKIEYSPQDIVNHIQQHFRESQ